AIIKQLTSHFRRAGIKSNLGVFFGMVEETAEGVRVTLADGKEFEAEIGLVATGRKANTANMGYEYVTIPRDGAHVAVNDRLYTGVGSVYAIGDIVKGKQLAHRGYQHGHFVIEEIMGNNPLKVEDRNIPGVTFTTPEIISVGMTEPVAQEQFG